MRGRLTKTLLQADREIHEAETAMRKVKKGLVEFEEKQSAVVQEESNFGKLMNFMREKLEYTRVRRKEKLGELRKAITANKERQRMEEVQVTKDQERRLKRKGKETSLMKDRLAGEKIEVSKLKKKVADQGNLIDSLTEAFAKMKTVVGDASVDRIVHKFLTRDEQYSTIVSLPGIAVDASHKDVDTLLFFYFVWTQDVFPCL